VWEHVPSFVYLWFCFASKSVPFLVLVYIVHVYELAS